MIQEISLQKYSTQKLLEHVFIIHRIITTFPWISMIIPLRCVKKAPKNLQKIKEDYFKSFSCFKFIPILL